MWNDSQEVKILGDQMGINKKRPLEGNLLGLEKPKKIAEEIIRDKIPESGQGKLLAQVGERIGPEGYEYIGSASVHFYRHKVRSDMALLSQVVNISSVPEDIALQGSKELGRKLMIQYGHTPPKKLDDKNLDPEV